jgi:hypothetical protein
MTEKQFWLMVRRALLMICKAIETRYLGDEPEPHPAS